MTYSWEFANTAAGRVLKAIQLRGEARIDELADDLGVTSSAIRQHLSQLKASGAVRFRAVREGVGRPYYLYALTPEGNSLFHRDYGDLARLLIEELAAIQGREALQAVLDRVTDRLAEKYGEELEGLDQEDRIAAWSALLERRGVMAQVEETDGGYVLTEHGCPYQGVALDDRTLCEMERKVMARVLRSRVQLAECTLDGHPGCCFHITPTHGAQGEGRGSEPRGN
ncbi:MAG: helix-turn-helix transcriptional regulator [Anaerolineae bacterium]